MAPGLDASQMQGVTRHFVTIGDRQVHYLRAGAGPCVVLLHGSPESGFSLLPLIHILKDRFTVIAPDTPGNGNSEPLTIDDPLIPDYARALGDLLDALGIKTCALYGFHTGADIAVCYSTQAPARVSMVLANGFPLFTEQEVVEILDGYLPENLPQWDGSHLTWLWARFVEQFIFFPWHISDQAHRLNQDNLTPEAIQFAVVQALRAGDEFRKPYRAAFKQKSEALIPLMTVPTIITALSSDALSVHLDRVGLLPPCARIERLGADKTEALQSFAKFFGEHPADKPPLSPPTIPRAERGVYQNFVTAAGGQVYYQKRDGQGRAIIALHDPASSSHLYDALLANPALTRPVYAIDLPGNGESDNTFPGGIPTIHGYAQKLGDILAALGQHEVDIIGYYSGGAVGVELSILHPTLVKNLGYVGAAYHEDEERRDLIAHYTPDISPRWDGTHLITAWRMMRQQSLYWPWYKMTKQAIIPGEPYLDNDMLQRRVVDLMKCGNTYQHAYRALFTYDTIDRLRKAPCRTWIGKLAWDPLQDRGLDIAKQIHAPVTNVPSDMSAWGPHFEKIFSD